MNTVCYVFVRHLPHTLNTGKLAAQVHHAGVKMVRDNGDMPLVKEHIANYCGTTIVLEPINPILSAVQISDIVTTAVLRNMPAGTYFDPTYPVDFELTCECLTCGYILLDKDSEDPYTKDILETIQNNWRLYK